MLYVVPASQSTLQSLPVAHRRSTRTGSRPEVGGKDEIATISSTTSWAVSATRWCRRWRTPSGITTFHSPSSVSRSRTRDPRWGGIVAGDRDVETARRSEPWICREDPDQVSLGLSSKSSTDGLGLACPRTVPPGRCHLGATSVKLATYARRRVLAKLSMPGTSISLPGRRSSPRSSPSAGRLARRVP